MRNPSPARDHFYAHVHDVTDECILWPFSLDEDGYGQLHLNGRSGPKSRAHIEACIIWHGPRPEGAQAAHGPCNNPACFNGAHLSWKTPQENQHDRRRDGTHLLGSRHFNTRLSEADVLDIRARWERGEAQVDIGVAYGISGGAVWRIVHRKNWRHI